MFQTSNSNNSNTIDLKLTISQSKLIARLADAELRQAENGISEFEENTLKHLLDLFMAVTQETPNEKAINDQVRAEKFEAWAAQHRSQVVNHE